jgi:hypothetical protein
MPRAIFCMALAMFSMRQPKEPMRRNCCWNSIIRFMSVETPEVEPQVTIRPPRFMRQHGAGPGVGADMFEHDIDALLLRQLAHDALEAVLAVVDDVIGAERPGRFDLGVGTDGGDDRAAHLLGKLDRRRADARAAGMDRMVSPGCNCALSNSMCSTVPKVIGATAAPVASTPGGAGTRSCAPAG